jgi:flagellar export protein FliJ
MQPKTLTRTLAIKERVRQWRRSELQETETRVSQAESAVESEAELHAGAVKQITHTGECSANDLALRAEEIEQTNIALKRARAALLDIEQERDARREVVSDATRDVRAIEALRTRLLAEQRRAADLREQRELDEASSRKGKRV